MPNDAFDQDGDEHAGSLVRIGNVWLPAEMVGRYLRVSVPFPPSVNHYWGQRVVHASGRKPFVQTYLTARAMEYRSAVQAIIRQRWPRLQPSESRIIFHVAFVAPDNRTRDLDNYEKAIKDSLTHAGFWDDDSQVDLTIKERRPVEKPGRLDLTILEKIQPCHAVPVP